MAAVNPTVPGFDSAAVERRASRIGDPVRKLRYLREQTAGQAGRGRRNRWLAVRAGAVALGALAVTLALPSPAVISDVSPKISVRKAFPEQTPASLAAPDRIWLVEEGKHFEQYSNGLRIDTQWQVSHERRFYQVLSRKHNLKPLPDWRSTPVGIVFHTTESHMVPFLPEQNRALKRFGHGLLASVQRNRSYHYVIDRFGRVFRLVEETDAANHAGTSIWADANYAYLNLNSSFLGVSFEARTAGQESEPTVTSAQILAARSLTQMLVQKYQIRPENCVTHAQVSVNAQNMLIGYHTDWITGFPFRELGLPPGYDVPPPSVALFGFDHDSTFRRVSGEQPWKGLTAAEAALQQEAAARGATLAAHRKQLRERYRELYSTLKLTGAFSESARGLADPAADGRVAGRAEPVRALD